MSKLNLLNFHVYTSPRPLAACFWKCKIYIALYVEVENTHESSENGEIDMALFVYILTNIMVPIFLLIAVGFIAQKKLKMDSRTFTRINMYILVPAVLFMKIYTSDVSLGFFGQMVLYIMIVQILMLLMGEGVSRILKYPGSKAKTFSNSLLFFNSGNYGLPMVELLYKGNPVATTAQIFIMLIQNVTTNTFGVFQASSGKGGYKKALKNVLQMPTLYVLTVVILVKLTRVQMPGQIVTTLDYISSGFVGLALITLGVQLAEVEFHWKSNGIFLSCFIRLVLSPLLGFALVRIMGIHGVLAHSLIIGVSTPSAVNTAIIAREFDNEPGYASQIVFVSTILSAFTIPVIAYLMG